MSNVNVQFGSGYAIFTPNAGDLAPNPTPIQFKIMQEGSVEFKADLKKLYGQYQGAVATARGKEDITGKLKLGSLDIGDLNQFRFGQTTATGGNVPIINESHAPSTSVTPSTASGAGIITDRGVINGSTGKQMVRVATTPAVGQYEFTPATTGGSPTPAVYIFNSSETAATVLLSYDSPVMTGTTLALANQRMGYAPEGSLLIGNTFRGVTTSILLNQVTFGSVSIPTKQEDFWIIDVDFSANVDAAGNFGALFTS